MLQASKLIPQGRGLAAVLVKRAATVELDWATRQQARSEIADSLGRRLVVFLPPGTVMRGGDILVAEDGSMVRVLAAPQAVQLVRPDPHHGSPFDLVRAAWHLGSRHVAIELQADHLKIEADHVVAQLLRGMHLAVEDAFAAFEPEGSAHDAHAGHEHDHSHAHKHAHDHDHEHDTQVHDHEHDSHEHGDHGSTHG